MSSVSVIIPCYNYARYLRGCVESVLQQEGVDVRVLVIDDCSPDNTAEIGSKRAAEDSRVEFRRHEVNKRHIATYNEGLAWASGDYTLLLSADDLLTPGALERAARLLDAPPDVSLAYRQQIWSGPRFIASLCSSGNNPVNTPTAVMRTRLLPSIGGYSAELPHTA